MSVLAQRGAFFTVASLFSSLKTTIDRIDGPTVKPSIEEVTILERFDTIRVDKMGKDRLGLDVLGCDT